MASRLGVALVAEDEPLIRWAIVTTLTSMGYDPRTASSREEARRALFDRAYDVVVIACELGDADMIDVIGDFARERTETRLVVLCAGECASTARAAAPAAAVLEKPFWVDDLTAAITGLRSGASVQAPDQST